MISKKELQEKYDISLNTVRKTLEVCGLDTSRAEYTEEEINDMFDVARRMLIEEKKSYPEIAEHFGGTFEEEAPSSARNSVNGAGFPTDSTFADPLAAAIHDNVEGYVQEVTDEAVEDVIAHLPQMIYQSAQRVVKSGAVNDVFQKMMEQRRAYREQYDVNGEVINVSAGLPFAEEDDDTEGQWEEQN